MPQVFDTPQEAGQAFRRWIRRTGFSNATQAMYASKVEKFLEFVAADTAGEYDGALSDEFVRDYAVRDFRRELMTSQKAAVSTVEGYLAAIGAFYDWMGLGKPRVKRQPAPKRDPKALDEDQLRKVMRVAERRGVRDHALTSLLFQTAVRVSEASALDVDDVWAGERGGTLEVRHGKGGESRQSPIPADTRDLIRRWLVVRRQLGAPEMGPLFIARGGGRLSVRRIQSLMTTMGQDAGLPFPLSPHVLRHTYARFFLDRGGDVGALQGVLGHKNLSSTQVYTGASANAIAEAAERVRIDL